MSTFFFEKSKEIANEFLQSIVFLDDKAFESNPVSEDADINQHAFDSSEISRYFAKEKKVCAVYKPVLESDIEDFKEISKKADIVILDWLITLQHPVDETEDLTADVDDEDPRGHYTKKIINELIETSGKDGLKLIVIYTGEDILDEIASDIYTSINDNPEFIFNEANCEVCSSNLRILVRGKDNGNKEARFKQRPHLLTKILTYSQLPSFVLHEFTLMTSGLLSNFALFSLTTIRNNSHKILNLFSKELDPAYLSHKALLPYSDDAERMLHHLLKDSIGDLLFYCNTGNVLSEGLINHWIDSHITDNELYVRNKKGKTFNPAVPFGRDKELLNKLLFSDNPDVDKRYRAVFKDILADEHTESFLDFLSKDSTMLFLNKNEVLKEEASNKSFAKLTHHKSLFLPTNIPPVLALGSIIKCNKTEQYFICIQQKCDSVRIKKDQERKFLFLPLKKVNDKQFDLITYDGLKLKLDKKSFALRTIKFKCDSDKGVIAGVLNDKGKHIFKNIYKEEFEWILDIKDLHSHRIVVDYASQLSRVGLDESEWLRRAAGNLK